MTDVREFIEVTQSEFDEQNPEHDFTCTSGTWVINDEKYTFVEQIYANWRCEGICWDTIVKRESDGKFFKFDVWDTSREYIFGEWDKGLTEVFQKTKITYG